MIINKIKESNEKMIIDIVLENKLHLLEGHICALRGDMELFGTTDIARKSHNTCYELIQEINKEISDTLDAEA